MPAKTKSVWFFVVSFVEVVESIVLIFKQHAACEGLSDKVKLITPSHPKKVNSIFKQAGRAANACQHKNSLMPFIKIV